MLMVFPVVWLAVLLLLAVQFGWWDRLVQYSSQSIAQRGTMEWDNQWCGIQIQQYPTDMMIYQELLWNIKPDVVIETGTFKGGNSFYLASLLEFIKPDAKVLTVDIDSSEWKKTLAEANFPGKDHLLQRIHFFEGSSVDPAILAKLKEHIGKDAKVLVLLDSDHRKPHVLNELKAYTPLVSVNSYVVVNDTQWGHPLEALQEFLKTTDAFVVDAAMDKFSISCAHGGFLKRVK